MNRAIAKQHAKRVVRRTIGEPYVGQRLKLRRIDNDLKQLRLHPEEILDAGGEDATLVYYLADRFRSASITAVDIDAAAVSACRAARPRSYADRVHFEVGTFSSLESDRFDLITVFNVLEHIQDGERAYESRNSALTWTRELLPGTARPSLRGRKWQPPEAAVT